MDAANEALKLIAQAKSSLTLYLEYYEMETTTGTLGEINILLQQAIDKLATK